MNRSKKSAPRSFAAVLLRSSVARMSANRADEPPDWTEDQYHLAQDADHATPHAGAMAGSGVSRRIEWLPGSGGTARPVQSGREGVASAPRTAPRRHGRATRHYLRGKRGEIRLMGLDRYGLVVNTVLHERRQDHPNPLLPRCCGQAGLCRALKSLMAHPLRPRNASATVGKVSTPVMRR